MKVKVKTILGQLPKALERFRLRHQEMAATISDSSIQKDMTGDIGGEKGTDSILVGASHYH